MTLSVEGKVTIITGATKGIGYGLAEGFAENGSNLIVVSRHKKDCLMVGGYKSWRHI